jgi:hypothetical protein
MTLFNLHKPVGKNHLDNPHADKFIQNQDLIDYNRHFPSGNTDEGYSGRFL